MAPITDQVLIRGEGVMGWGIEMVIRVWVPQIEILGYIVILGGGGGGQMERAREK